MVKRLKNIWFWIDILLIILCAFFYLLANPILWKSGVARHPKPWLHPLVPALLDRQAPHRQIQAPGPGLELELGAGRDRHRNLPLPRLLPRMISRKEGTT